MLDINRLCPGCMNDSAGKRICTICGYDAAVDNATEHLSIKTRLARRYLVGRTVAIDSEGITYIGFDAVENSIVYIKEYFPSDIAVRNPDKTVSTYSENAFPFNEGLMNFIDIAKKLIGSELPSLVSTFACFEENGTAYKIVEKPSGITLKDFLIRNGGTLSYPQARPLFLPLIDTVKGLNEQGIIHGGISPETIIVGRDGRLRLSDIFIPAARKSGCGITPELYAGYAALEQYGINDTPLSGATDVYGLCTTLFKVIVGNELPAACERVGNAGMSIPAKLADELPRQVLVALANGLQLPVDSRTATVERFKNELVYGETEENARRAANRQMAEKRAAEPQKTKKKSGAAYAGIAAICTVLICVIIGFVLCFTVFKDQIFKANEELNESTVSYSAPSQAEIGDFDSEAVESVRLFAVPNVLGKYYSEIIDNDEYEDFKFKIKGKEYSSKYSKGTVCVQSVAAGSEVEKGTEILITISLGPEEVRVPNLLGLDEASAKIELLKQGFLYENIEVVEKYDVESKPGIVLEQSPAPNSTVSPETMVRIYINSYEGEIEDGPTGFVVENDSSSSGSSSQNSSQNSSGAQSQ